MSGFDIHHPSGRDEIRDDLAETVRSHYDSLERTADDAQRLGYKVAAEILRAQLPQTDKGRSGDPGEISATELVEEEIGLKTLRADRIDHMLFTMSGNGPHASLKDDLEGAGTNRDQSVVILHIEDHQDFIKEMYEKADDVWDWDCFVVRRAKGAPHS